MIDDSRYRSDFEDTRVKRTLSKSCGSRARNTLVFLTSATAPRRTCPRWSSHTRQLRARVGRALPRTFTTFVYSHPYRCMLRLRDIRARFHQITKVYPPTARISHAALSAMFVCATLRLSVEPATVLSVAVCRAARRPLA